MHSREQLVDLFRSRALRRGTFTLASGKTSNFYLDGKQVTLHSTGLRLIAHGLLDLLADVDFQAIGGMSIGADPIVAGVLVAAAERNRALDGFLVRREAKGHGTNRFIEGPLKPGARVIVVDDVVTTGGSALRAVDRVEQFGAQVVHVAAVVDRGEGAAQAFAARGLPFSALLSLDDLGIAPSGM